jgi:hypothetical protein
MKLKISFPQTVEYKSCIATIYLQKHASKERFEVRYCDLDGSMQPSPLPRPRWRASSPTQPSAPCQPTAKTLLRCVEPTPTIIAAPHRSNSGQSSRLADTTPARLRKGLSIRQSRDCIRAPSEESRSRMEAKRVEAFVYFISNFVNKKCAAGRVRSWKFAGDDSSALSESCY